MTCLLVVAKAPVAGQAKTRLSPAVGTRQAALLAAAALLDTLDAVLATPDTVPVVALSGELSHAERATELAAALARCTVFPQRGNDFADRLANAHADTANLHLGRSILQIGMDTPQVSPELLANSIEALHAPSVDAVLGPATDGGWWSLGLREPANARVLRAVPLSRADTGARTLLALRDRDLNVSLLPILSDVDTPADLAAVAALAPGGRFARAVTELAGAPAPAAMGR